MQVQLDAIGERTRKRLTKADFGSSRPNILIVLSIVAFGIGFGWLGVHTANRWEVATGMYIVGREYRGCSVCCVLAADICSNRISNDAYLLDCSLPWPRTEHVSIEGQGRRL